MWIVSQLTNLLLDKQQFGLHFGIGDFFFGDCFLL